MIYLSFDLGLTHTGVAISYEGSLVSPLESISTKNKQDPTKKLTKRIISTIEKYNPNIIVIGQPSHGFIRQLAQNLKSEILKIFPKIETHLISEDLSSKEANLKIIQSTAKKSKRRKLIHSVSAVIILENFLDSN